MPRGIVNRRDKFNWDNCHMPDGQSLPRVTPDDSGKILTVDENGKWSADESEVSKEITNAGIAHFVDAANAPLADLKVDIKAVQAGSGDPSLTNVRPIAGWTGVNVYDVDGKFITKINSVNTTKNITNAIRVLQLDVTANKSYTVYCNQIFDYTSNVRNTLNVRGANLMVYENGAITNNYHNSKGLHSLTFTANATETVEVYIWVSNADVDNVYTNFFAIERNKGMNTTNINISWNDVAGTVYGGTLDVLTGKLTVTHKAVDLGDLTWNYVEEYQRFAASDLSSSIKIPTSESVPFNGLCSIYKIVSRSIISSVNNAIGCFSNGSIGVRDSEYTDAATFKTAVTGQTLVYELATPIVYNLMPTEVYSLLGENNIFANSGDILSVSYVTREYAPLTAMIEDKIPLELYATEDFGTGTISLVGATSTDVKNYLLSHKNANIVIHVQEYSTIVLYHLREYSPNSIARFATPGMIGEAEGEKFMRVDCLQLDLSQETSDFTKNYIMISGT